MLFYGMMSCAYNALLHVWVGYGEYNHLVIKIDHVHCIVFEIPSVFESKRLVGFSFLYG